MSRRGVGIIVAVALVGLLFAAVTTSGGVQMWGEPEWDPAPRTIEPIETDIDADANDAAENAERSTSSTIELPRWLTVILNAIAATAGVLVLVTLLVAAWHRRPRLRWGRRRGGSRAFEVLPDVATAVVEEAETQRTELLSGAPRNAIVRCWLRLEHDVAAAGLPRHPADTAAEFTERVLAEYSVDARAIGDLAGLYREARFSDHALDETARQSALDALDRLHRTLAGDRDGTPSDTSTEDAR